MEAIERAEKKETDTADTNTLNVPGVPSAMATVSRPTSSVSVKSKPTRLGNERSTVTLSKVVEEIKICLSCLSKITDLSPCRSHCRCHILNSWLLPKEDRFHSDGRPSSFWPRPTGFNLSEQSGTPPCWPCCFPAWAHLIIVKYFP